MAIPLLPLLGTLSSLAGTAWDTYNKVKQIKAISGGRSTEKQAQAGLTERLERLEETCLDQARMFSELSKDVEQLARAIQSQIEEGQRRYQRTAALLYVSIGVAVAALGVSSWLLLR